MGFTQEYEIIVTVEVYASFYVQATPWPGWLLADDVTVITYNGCWVISCALHNQLTLTNGAAIT